MAPADPWRPRGLLAFATASLLAVVFGAVAMALDGAGPGLWLRNPAAWLLAAGLGVVLARRGWPPAIAAPLALIGIALSFMGPAQEDVRRWIGVGPVQLNAAALVLPLAIAGFARTPAWLAASCFVLIAVALALQPDISQLAAFVLGATILSAFRFGSTGAVAAAVISGCALALCLTRPDPLEPVRHVEDIFLVAWSQSPILAAAIGLSLAAAVLSPLLLLMDARRPAALGLAGYFAVSTLAVFLGPYPTPLAGYGISFIVGWWLGLAALAAGSQKDPES